MLYPEHEPVTKETIRSFVKLSVPFGLFITILWVVKGPWWMAAIAAVSTIGLIVRVFGGHPR